MEAGNGSGQISEDDEVRPRPFIFFFFFFFPLRISPFSFFLFWFSPLFSFLDAPIPRAIQQGGYGDGVTLGACGACIWFMMAAQRVPK